MRLEKRDRPGPWGASGPVSGPVARRWYRRWLTGPAGALAWSLAALVLCSPVSAATSDAVEIEVNKTERLLIVRDGEEVREVFPISLGRGGPGDKRRTGDQKTPVGTYRVVGFNDSSRFDFFIRLNYPNVKDAFYGLKSDVISREEFDRIVQALRLNRLPPQNTALGGAIGIHGIGAETAQKINIHDKLDWTEGCIALRNELVHRLRDYVRVGTRVVIRE